MKQLKKVLPILSILFAILLHKVIPDSKLHPLASRPYYTYFLIAVLIIYLVFYVASFFRTKLEERLTEKAPLFAGAVLLINVINLVTVKFVLLPVLFFPSLDRIFGVFVNDRELLVRCIIASFKLLLNGFAIGAVLGFVTGLLLGFSKRFSYWVTPLTKVIGPIPATSWSPLVLSLFSTSYQAAIFMIALAVWFPITLMTSSGIQNVQNSYFEVSSTLGAGRLYKIFKVGVPAAMPQIFLGVFYATCGSFVTLVTAEMFGCESGIGWYLNWQKSMMLYANVYAGLILLAGICTLVITLVFRIKDKILIWQKGVIKW